MECDPSFEHDLIDAAMHYHYSHAVLNILICVRLPSLGHERKFHIKVFIMFSQDASRTLALMHVQAHLFEFVVDGEMGIKEVQ